MSLPRPLFAARSVASSAARSAARSVVLDRVQTWSVESQLGARRNAMVASTALAARRVEREDVAEFFAALEPRDQVLHVAVAHR
jgi:hypothetical protein